MKSPANANPVRLPIQADPNEPIIFIQFPNITAHFLPNEAKIAPKTTLAIADATLMMANMNPM